MPQGGVLFRCLGSGARWRAPELYNAQLLKDNPPSILAQHVVAYSVKVDRLGTVVTFTVENPWGFVLVATVPFWGPHPHFTCGKAF